MTYPAIQAVDIGKRYRLGEREPYRALRDSLAKAVRFPLRALRRGDGSRSRTPEYVWALRDISFDVRAGEVVGVIGRNGAGKTTLLKILARITEPTAGRGEIRGSVGSLLEVGTGFHPELTGRENVYLNGAVLGMRRSVVDRKFDEIIAFAGVETFVDTPVKRYSTGMQMRLAFAVAAHLETDIILVDEILAVGDAEFQKRCMGKMETIGSQGRTVLFVSHSMPSILRLCPRVILLDGGHVIADGPAHQVVRTYLDTGLGTSGSREWRVPDDAPGGEYLRLKSVRIRDSTGKFADTVDIRHPIDVEVEFWKLPAADALRPIVTLGFSNEDGVLLFVSSDVTNPDGDESTRGFGVGRSVCRIPGNFLAEGQVLVHVELGTSKAVRREVRERDVVAFQVVDQSTGEGVRGEFTRDWPGVVRPMLEWHSEFTPHTAESPR